MKQCFGLNAREREMPCFDGVRFGSDQQFAILANGGLLLAPTTKASKLPDRHKRQNNYRNRSPIGGESGRCLARIIC